MDSILIVDDDQQICSLLSDYLSEFDMQVTTASDGKSMLAELKNGRFDLIILDLMLPGDDGITLCRNLRKHSGIPILILTAKGESADRVGGLEVGADDYVVKPFEPRELVARIHTILRRYRNGMVESGRSHEITHFMGWRLNNILRQLISPDELVIPLSNAEFRLMKVFVENPNKILSRDYLMDQARGRNMELFDRSIDLLVSRLRQKIGDDPRMPSLIKTVRGEGYIFESRMAR